MNREDLKALIIKNSEFKNDKYYLSCEVAHELAKEHDLKLKDIGALCNEDNIRIFACELGCF
ncbi:MAG: hypothetical protein QMB63_06900 [Clostridiaceae bacterium]